MKYTQWSANPPRFLAMTGYTLLSFTALLPFFITAHDAYYARYNLQGKRRKGIRSFVIYQNSPLPTHEERLAFILSYLKLNPLQEAHADLFDMEQKQCNMLIHSLKEVLDRALRAAQVMPASTNEQLQEKLAAIETEADKELLHDATEREIPRPKDPSAQKENYSGKKKSIRSKMRSLPR